MNVSISYKKIMHNYFCYFGTNKLHVLIYVVYTHSLEGHVTTCITFVVRACNNLGIRKVMLVIIVSFVFTINILSWFFSCAQCTGDGQTSGPGRVGLRVINPAAQAPEPGRWHASVITRHHGTAAIRVLAPLPKLSPSLVKFGNAQVRILFNVYMYSFIVLLVYMIVNSKEMPFKTIFWKFSHHINLVKII